MVSKKSHTQEILEPTLEALGISPYIETSAANYMDSKMLAHFTNILTAMRSQIMQGVDRTVVHLKEEAINYADPNDRASQEEDFRLELRARDRERKLLKKIEEALELIVNKEYGYCELCGINIGLHRLEARPTATLCVDCKALEELREKQKISD